MEAAKHDLDAVVFLIATAASAIGSIRFASLVNPVPSPEHFDHHNTGECDIDALRRACEVLPDQPEDLCDLSVVKSLPVPTRALLFDALFGPNTDAAYVTSVGPDVALLVRSRDRSDVSFDAVESQTLTRAQGPRPSSSRPSKPRRFVVQVESRCPSHVPVAHTQDREAAQSYTNVTAFASSARQYGTFRAFHGAVGAAWYSILRRGLREFPNDPAFVSSGRVFGDGIYLAERIDIALAFASPSPAFQRRNARRLHSRRSGSLQWPSELSVVGVFDVVHEPETQRAGRDGSSLPPHYVVAKEGMVRLTELVVLRSEKSGASVGRTLLFFAGVYLMILLLVGNKVWDNIGRLF